MGTGRKTLGELQDELTSMPEYRLRLYIQSLNHSIFIFNKNFEDLRKLIEFMTDSNDPRSVELSYLRNRDRLEYFQLNIIRLLHNYVSASLSLIDHTRRQYRNLYSEESFPEYQKKVDDLFKTDPLSQFVKGLRIYCQHYATPSLGNRWEITKEEDIFCEETTIILYKDDLISFDGWSSHAKKYLKTLPDEIEILEILSAYHEKVIDFHNWYREKQIEIHAEELDRFEQKQQEFIQMKITQDVNSCFSRKGENLNIEDELFIGIFRPENFEELEQIPSNSPDRYTRAIEILESYIPISVDLKQKIIDIYKSKSP